MYELKSPSNLQVLIASNPSEKENKLFVGMLPRPIDELVLYQLFIAYGELREVYVIRLPDGSSRGCAFIKYRQRSEALELNKIIPPVNIPFHRFMQLPSIALMNAIVVGRQSWSKQCPG